MYESASFPTYQDREATNEDERRNHLGFFNGLHGEVR